LLLAAEAHFSPPRVCLIEIVSRGYSLRGGAGGQTVFSLKRAAGKSNALFARKTGE